MKLLITQGTTPFAQRVAKRFSTGLPARICFASSAPVPQVLLDAGQYKRIPAAGQSTFVHELLKLALDQEATYLLPLGREEAVLLAGSKLLFSEYGIQVLAPDPADLQYLEVMENPPRQLELSILDGGKKLVHAPGETGEFPATGELSGVFCFNDDGTPYWCLSATGFGMD